MRTASDGRAVSVAELAARLRSESYVLAVSHEAPDGDALGCVSALLLVCESLRIECDAYIPGEGALPSEYVFLPRLDRVFRGTPPPMKADATVYFLDCASLIRSNSHEFIGQAVQVNIDHHQDNPGYAELNLVVPDAPSTSAILYDIFKAGGFQIGAEVATALYVGLVTDTGRFQYSNTTPHAHRMAAELQEAGLDVGSVYRQIYESTPLPKLLLLQRALGRLQIRLRGALAVSWLGNEDFVKAGADEGHAEGLIDTLRRVQGVRVAVLARERSREGVVETKVSLRSTDGKVDVAALAHKRGGGGHSRAAGFTSPEDVQTVLAWIESQVEESL